MGAIRWDEIENIYPWDGATLFFNIPIRKFRFLVIHLKTGDYLERLDRRSAFYAKQGFRHRKGHYVCVQEALLSTPVPEIMLRLNRFYLENVAVNPKDDTD